MSQAIRLTNKTAIALRKTAKQVRAAHIAAAVLLSLALAACAVLLGLYWLPTVPLVVLLAALMDGAIMLRARSRYLSLIAQAICTEAAAQEIRTGRSEKSRRARAISDLMSAKADVQRTMGGGKKESAAEPFPEQEDAQEIEKLAAHPGKTGVSRGGALLRPESVPEPAQDGAQPRRRRKQKSLQLIRGEQA